MDEEDCKRGVIVCKEIICVREEPDMNSGPIYDLENGTEVMVDLNKSTEKFCNVCTAYGVEGYVLAKYVQLQ